MLCKCGCGQEFITTSRATLWRIKKGDPNTGYINGHQVRGSKNPRWNNRKSTKDGYVLVWSPSHPNARKSGYILEHRLVMSEHIGRAILPTEDVHHRNGNRADNRLENLELLTHSVHVAMHATSPHACNRKPTTPKICPTCGKSFVKRWRGNHARDVFCSRKCIARTTMPRGTKHHNAVLNDDLVREIRRRAAAGESHQSIADDLGFNRRNISRVADRSRWSHVA